MAKAVNENVRPNRTSRQKQNTRSALIKAAFSVMARKGVDATTINDITEAADVGFGSFYNYFSSKEDVHEVVTGEVLERIGNYIDDTVGYISDPWELLASALRLFVETMLLNPDLAQFAIRMSVRPGHKHTQISERLYRDIGRAMESGGPRIADPVTVTYAVGGANLFMVMALLTGDFPAANASNRIAAAGLRILGLSEDEIARLLSKPLPKVGKISLDD